MINEDKKKVLIVNTDLGFGGRTKALIQLLLALDFDLYDITLYIRRNDVVELLHSVPQGLRLVFIDSIIPTRSFPSTTKGKLLTKIYHLINKKHRYLAKRFYLHYAYPIERARELATQAVLKEKYDIAICYSTDKDDPVFVLQCVNALKKYVVVHQSTEIQKKNVQCMMKYDKVIAVNPLLVPWLKSLVKSRTEVISIELYSDENAIRNQAKESFAGIKRSGKLHIATCGRLCSTKGYDYVVNAARQLRREGYDFCWYWIGDGQDRMKMVDLINQYGLNSSIEITGMLTNPYPYIKYCDIYVQPSRFEAYGLTIQEALMLFKPVISTRTVGAEYIFGKYHCGILCDLSTESLVEKVKLLIDNPAIKKEKEDATRRINWAIEKERFVNQWNEMLI